MDDQPLFTAGAAARVSMYAAHLQAVGKHSDDARPGRRSKIGLSHPSQGATHMSDDKSQSQGQDRQRINVNQDYELRDWAKSLDTTPERLKEAVQAVGDRAEKVREYLKNDKPGR